MKTLDGSDTLFCQSRGLTKREGDRVSKGDLRLSDYITEQRLRRVVEMALEEDLGRGDVTSDLSRSAGCRARAVLRSRSEGVIAGLDVAARCLPSWIRGVIFLLRSETATVLASGQELAEISGAARSLLRAEESR